LHPAWNFLVADRRYDQKVSCASGRHVREANGFLPIALQLHLGVLHEFRRCALA
jgi:hypothetical protein